MPDITLVNLNMLFMRYGDRIERELHIPLGCLYLTRALEAAGYQVDFRDYQLVASDQPFDMEVFLEFLRDASPVVGLSCMANLLPFSLLAAREIRRRWPDRTILLGGVGTKGVEDQVLKRFPWIDILCRGEGELTGPDLMRTLRQGGDLAGVAGISWRTDYVNGFHRGSKACTAASVVHNPHRPRITDLDSIGFPAWEKVDLGRYAGYGMMSSRGCPYPCTFCSVAPVWDLQSFSRSPRNIVDEMLALHRNAGVTLFLFQDEFFVSGKRQVMEFCRLLRAEGPTLRWKAFGRVNLIDEEMMRAMADSGCLELRFGIESGSGRVLRKIRKGFTTGEVLELVPKAVEIFPRTDTFYVWGFPFETMEDFHQSLFQMVSFRTMGARVLPSLLSLLPQTEIYRQLAGKVKLEFCPYLLPEFVFTGHEITSGSQVTIPPQYREYFQVIQDNPDIFPGFFHVNLAGNVLPKLECLRECGFYTRAVTAPAAGEDKESCGAHSPRLGATDSAIPGA